MRIFFLGSDKAESAIPSKLPSNVPSNAPSPTPTNVPSSLCEYQTEEVIRTCTVAKKINTDLAHDMYKFYMTGLISNKSEVYSSTYGKGCKYDDEHLFIPSNLALAYALSPILLSTDIARVHCLETNLDVKKCKEGITTSWTYIFEGQLFFIDKKKTHNVSLDQIPLVWLYSYVINLTLIKYGNIMLKEVIYWYLS